jgi:hypothetical protein
MDEAWTRFVPDISEPLFKFHSCNWRPWFRVVSRKQRRSNYANYRENRCDTGLCWRNRGQQHGTSRSLVPSSLLPSSLRLPSSLLPSSLLRLLSSVSPSPSLRLVSLLSEGILRPPQPAAFSFGLVSFQKVGRMSAFGGKADILYEICVKSRTRGSARALFVNALGPR